MTFGGLPLIGVHAIITGLAAFQRDSTFVASRMAFLGTASARLASQSAAMSAGTSGGLMSVSRATQAYESALARVTVAQNAVANSAQHVIRSQAMHENALIRVDMALNRVAAAQARVAATSAAYAAGNASAAQMTAATNALASAEGRLQIAQNALISSTSTLTVSQNNNAAAQARLTTASTAAAAAQERLALAQGQAAATSMAAGAAIKLGFLAIGVAAAVAAGASLIWASQFEKSMNEIRILSNETREAQDRLGTTILEMGRNSTIGIKGAVEASRELALAGVDIQEQLDGALETTVKLVAASIGTLGAEDAANLTARAMRTYGIEAGNTSRVLAAATAVQVDSVATYADFAKVINIAGASTKSVGFEMEDLAAITMLATETMQSGSTVGTALRQTIQRLVKPTSDGAEIMRELGISLFDAQGKARGARAIISDLNRTLSDEAVATGKVTEAQRAMLVSTIAETRARELFLILANTTVEEFDALHESIERVGQLDVAGQLLLPLSEQLEITGSHVKGLSTALGTGLVDAVKPAVLAINSFLKSIKIEDVRSFSDGIAITAFQIGALAEVINTNDIPGLFADVTTGAEKLAAGFMGIAGASVIAVAGILGVVSPVVLLAGTVALGVKLILDNWDSLAETTKAVFDFIGKALETLASNFNAWAKHVVNAATMGWSGIVDVTVKGATNAFNNTTKFLADMAQNFGLAGNSIQSKWATMWEGLGEIASRAVQAIGVVVSGALAALGGTVSAAGAEELGGQLTGLSGQVARGAQGMAADLKGAIRSVAGSVEGLVNSPAWEKFTKDASKDMEEFKSRAVDAFNSAATRIKAGTDAIGEFLAKVRALAEERFKLARAVETAAGGQQPPPRGEAPPAGSFPPGKDGGADKAQKAFERAMSAALELEEDTMRAIANVHDEILAKIIQIGEKVGERTKQAIIDADEAIQKLNKQARESVREAEAGLALQRETRSRREALDQILKFEETARKRIREMEEVAERRGLEILDEILQEQRDVRERAFQEELDLIDLQTSRRLDADERARDAGRDALMDSLEERHEAIRDALEAEQDLRERAFKEQQDLAEQEFKRGQENAELQLERQNALAEAEEERQRKLGRAFFQAQRDRINKEHEEEVKSINEEFDAKEAETDFEREQEDSLLEFKKRQDEEYLAFKAQLEAEARALRQAQEEEERELRRKLDEEDIRRRIELEDEARARQAERDRKEREFQAKEEALAREEQWRREDERRMKEAAIEEQEEINKENADKRRRQLSDQLDDEELARRIANIQKENTERVTQVNIALDKKHQEILKDAQREIKATETTMADKIRTIQEKYLDKLPEILEQGGDRMIPVMEEIASRMEEQFDKIRDAATDAANAMAAATGIDLDIPEFQHGGVVPGPYGKPRLVIAHGGERFLGMGSATPTIVQLAQAGHGPQNVTNSYAYNYNVNASYANQQSPSTISMDLKAITMMARGR